MRAFVRSSGPGALICGAMALSRCGGDHTASNAAGGSNADSGGSNEAASSTSTDGAIGAGDSSSGTDAGSSGDAASDADAGPLDPCGNALFCEKFDNYAGVTAIADQQKFGPWHAALGTGATMGLDGMHKVSGSNALHVHIDNAATAGGRLFADGQKPIFANGPTHVYGRMMMYIDPNGTSVHWTFFGVNGNAEPSSPVVGRNAQYIMSSLPKNGVNTYSFVYGLEAMGGDGDGYHDCSSQSSTSMPSAWACVSFEMDSVARKLRMCWGDGAVDPILSVDDHGTGCALPPRQRTSPWYGPLSIAQLFVGAWELPSDERPLDVCKSDDLVVDTKPVSCPPQ